MPDLGWDITETQLIQENQKENNPNPTPPLQTLITIIILIIAILKQLITQIKEITKRAAQAMENTIKEASHNKTIPKHQGFPQNNNASDNSSDQYDQPYQPQWTSPNKQ